MKNLKDILVELIEHRRCLNYSKQTLKTTKSRATTFIRFLDQKFSVSTPDALKPDHLRQYQKHLPTMKGKSGLPLRPGSINGLIIAVHILLDYMLEFCYIALPMKKYLEPVKEDKLLPTSVLEHNQVKKLINAIDISSAEGIRNRAIVELMYSSGIRGGELVTMKLENVDLKSGVARVMGKGRKERIVPIGKTAVRYLKNYISGVRPFIKNCESLEEVFLTNRGTSLKLRSLQEMIMVLSESVRLDVRVTPHTLRRSCATEMIRGNANMYHVKEILGHESIETLKNYAKLTILDLKRTHNKCHPRDRLTL